MALLNKKKKECLKINCNHIIFDDNKIVRGYILIRISHHLIMKSTGFPFLFYRAKIIDYNYRDFT